LKIFLDSPLGKTKGTRFKRCKGEKDVSEFYDAQNSPSCNKMDDNLESDLPYKVIPNQRLTQFRVAIEKKEDKLVGEMIK